MSHSNHKPFYDYLGPNDIFYKENDISDLSPMPKIPIGGFAMGEPSAASRQAEQQPSVLGDSLGIFSIGVEMERSQCDVRSALVAQLTKEHIDANAEAESTQLALVDELFSEPEMVKGSLYELIELETKDGRRATLALFNPGDSEVVRLVAVPRVGLALTLARIYPKRIYPEEGVDDPGCDIVEFPGLSKVPRGEDMVTVHGDSDDYQNGKAQKIEAILCLLDEARAHEHEAANNASRGQLMSKAKLKKQNCMARIDRATYYLDEVPDSYKVDLLAVLYMLGSSPKDERLSIFAQQKMEEIEQRCSEFTQLGNAAAIKKNKLDWARFRALSLEDYTSSTPSVFVDLMNYFDDFTKFDNQLKTQISSVQELIEQSFKLMNRLKDELGDYDDVKEKAISGILDLKTSDEGLYRLNAKDRLHGELVDWEFDLFVEAINQTQRTLKIVAKVPLIGQTDTYFVFVDSLYGYQPGNMNAATVFNLIDQVKITPNSYLANVTDTDTDQASIQKKAGRLRKAFRWLKSEEEI